MMIRKDTNTLDLVSIRQRKGISIEEIADRTKISLRSLRAIEAGDFKKLPGGIYNTNYIRQYARLIEIDEAELLAVYYRQMELEPEPELSPVKTSELIRNPITRLFRHPSAVAGS